MRGSSIQPRRREMQQAGSCPFQTGGKPKQAPKFPKWGLQTWRLDALGLEELPGGMAMGQSYSHHQPQGSVGYQHYTTVPKGTPERAVMPLWSFGHF